MSLTYSVSLETDSTASDVRRFIRTLGAFEEEEGTLVAPGVTAIIGSLDSRDRLDAYSQSIYLEEKGLVPSVIVTFTVDKFELRQQGEVESIDTIVSLGLKFGSKAFATYLGGYPVLARREEGLVLDAGWAAARPELANRITETHVVDDLPGAEWLGPPSSPA